MDIVRTSDMDRIFIFIIFVQPAVDNVVRAVFEWTRSRTLKDHHVVVGNTNFVDNVEPLNHSKFERRDSAQNKEE